MEIEHTLMVNGVKRKFKAPNDLALLWALRDKLNLNGTKYGCGVNVCKSCTCLVDGKKATACSLSVADVKDKSITTIEGLADTAANGAKDQDTNLHVVQKIWIDMDVAQCGFCQPGQIMAAVGLLRATRNFAGMSEAQKDAAIDTEMTNVCRCGTYDRIRKAIKKAATVLGSVSA